MLTGKSARKSGGSTGPSGDFSLSQASSLSPQQLCSVAEFLFNSFRRERRVWGGRRSGDTGALVEAEVKCVHMWRDDVVTP